MSRRQTDVLLAALLLALSVAGGLCAFIVWREQMPVLLSMEVHFGSDVTVEAAVALLTCLASLPRASRVVLEVVGDARGLTHRLHAPQSALDVLRAQLRGVLPSLRFEPAPIEDLGWLVGLRLRWTGTQPVLRTDQVEPTTAALLASFAQLGPREALRLCWILSPTARPPLPQHERQRQAWPWFMPREPSGEHLRALRVKYAGPLLRASALVMAQSEAKPRARQLVGRVIALLRSRGTGWGRLHVRPVRVRPLMRLLRGWQPGSVCSPAELAPLVGLPIAAPRIPGLTLSSAPQLMPAVGLPQRGRVVARSDWPGMEDRLLVQPVVGALSHSLIVGPTGSGKSHVLAGLIEQDMTAGRGCLVLDGKGDLAEDVLARVPPARQADVIVLDPGTNLPLPGLRVFGRGTDPELTADLVLGIFRDLFADSWGVRSDTWLRAGFTTLAHDPQATLADLPFLFSDPHYRARLTGRLHDPLLLDTWASFEAMSPAARTQQLGSPLSKIMEVIGRRVVRGVLAQPDAMLDLRAVLRQRKIVVVALSAGRIGTPAARLIGALVVHELFQAVQGRASLPRDRRWPFFAYIDEPAVLGDMPVPLDSLFELARGLGVGLNLGVQSLMQLPKEVMQAALTNAATIVAFKQAADDAQLVARELVSLRPEELQGLGRFGVAVRLGLGPGDLAPVATGVTLPLREPVSDSAAVRRASAERYGRTLASVDEALRQRHGLRTTAARSPEPDTPIGRTRRRP